MTDQELIQALRCCNGLNGCTDCPRQHCGQPMLKCTEEVLNEAIDRLEALIAENKKYSKMIYELNHENEVLRSQTIHLKAEQLPECMRTAPPSTEGVE